MSEDMRLKDFRPKTRDAYWRAVRQFLEHVKKEPSALTEEYVRSYLIHMRDERMLAPSTRNIAVHGLRFFFTYTCPHDW
jgi:site-specific recombinase XerD